MKEVTATPNEFLEQERILKKDYRRTFTNIFKDWEALQRAIEVKPCRLLTFPGVLLLLIPRFQIYDDIFYIAASKEALAAGLATLQTGYPKERTMHITVVGKEQTIAPEVEVLSALRFTQVSILARTRNRRNPAMAAVLHNILAARDDADIYQPRFAEEADAYGVYELLASEFDICGDSLPEPEEVLENIRKRQVIVIEDMGRIVCAHYFTIYNCIYFSLYDVTHKDYRKKFLLPRIVLFTLEVNDSRLKNIKLIHGWRNTAKQKLMIFAKKNNEIPDGVFIYNFVWSSNKVELTRAPS